MTVVILAADIDFAVTKLPQIKTRRSFPFVAAISESARRQPDSQTRLDEEPQKRA